MSTATTTDPNAYGDEQHSKQFKDLDRPGNFRVVPRDYTLFKANSGAMAVNVNFVVDAEWNGEEWHDWRQYGEYTVEGSFWIKKKDGTRAEDTIAKLIEHMGWDGRYSSVVDQSWKAGRCQVLVNEEEYKGIVRFKAAFVNGWDAKPGRGSNVPLEIAKALDAQEGAAMRAIAANIKQQGKPAPQGRPPARATTAKGAIQAAVQADPLPEERPALPTDEVPF